MEEIIAGAFIITGILCAPRHREDTLRSRLVRVKSLVRSLRDGIEKPTSNLP